MLKTNQQIYKKQHSRYLIVVGVTQLVFDEGTLCFTCSRVHALYNAVQHHERLIYQRNVGMSNWRLQ